MPSPAAARLRQTLEPIVTAAGVDLEDVLIRPAGKRKLVQVIVDRDGGITLDDVAEVARSCSDALDADDVLDGAYVLEVTSPGVDRPLTEPRHWRRNVGRRVEARRVAGGPLVGRLLSADDAGVVLDVSGVSYHLAYGELSRGVVEVEFNRPDDTQGEVT